MTPTELRKRLQELDADNDSLRGRCEEMSASLLDCVKERHALHREVLRLRLECERLKTALLNAGGTA